MYEFYVRQKRRVLTRNKNREINEQLVEKYEEAKMKFTKFIRGIKAKMG